MYSHTNIVYIYIPKKGIRCVNPKQDNIVRDKEIFEKYKNGYKVGKLADEYYISTYGVAIVNIF